MDARLRKAADYLLACRDAADVRPGGIGAALMPIVFVLDVARRPDGRMETLKIRQMGTELDGAFGRSLTGRNLGDFVHGPRGGQVMAGFVRCADERLALWMRQIVHVKGDLPRFVEGLAVHLAPDRIYGALQMGKLADRSLGSSFSLQVLERTCDRPAMPRAAELLPSAAR